MTTEDIAFPVVGHKRLVRVWHGDKRIINASQLGGLRYPIADKEIRLKFSL